MGSDEKLLVRDGSVWVERKPSPGLAAKLSRDHGTIAVEWSIHTAVDQIWIVAYRAGEVVRELRYAVSEGWTKRGKALPFENTARLGKFLRKRRLLASPDGYEVLDAFLGKQPPAPVVEPGATYDTSFSPAQAAELSAIAERASVRVSVVVETCWHLAKQVIYDRRMARATKLGLDLTMLVDDTSPPPPTESLPAFVHEPIDARPIELTRYSGSAIPHQLALSAQMLAELDLKQALLGLKIAGGRLTGSRTQEGRVRVRPDSSPPYVDVTPSCQFVVTYADLPAQECARRQLPSYNASSKRKKIGRSGRHANKR